MEALDPIMEDALGPRNETSRDALVCKCGHTGYLVFRDRSSPFRCQLEFSLEGFTGAEVTVADYDYVPEDIFEALQPACPACGQTGTVGNPNCNAR